MTETMTRSPLGQRAKPGLILSIGRIVGTGDRTHPERLDYFRAKDGPYLEKFAAVFGEKPTEIPIAIPDNDFGHVLDVRWKAYGSSGRGQGGYLKCLGATNFADLALAGDLEAMNGPTGATAWKQDGTKSEIELSGPADPLIEKGGLKLYTTFRFWVPDVLGVGSWGEIATTSRVSTDNLFSTLAGMYRSLRGQWKGLPLVLYLQPATARPVVDGKRISSRYWAIAVRSPLSVIELVEQHKQLESIQERAPLALPPVDHEDIGRDEELAGLYERESTASAAIRDSVAGLPAPPDEPVRTREEPSASDRPDDALLNRIAARAADVGTDAAQLLLLGAFGVEDFTLLPADRAQAYLDGLERLPDDGGEGEVVSE